VVQIHSPDQFREPATCTVRRRRRPPGFQQQNQKIQVLYLVPLRSQRAILSLPSVVPNLYRTPRAYSAELFPPVYFRCHLPEIRNVEASANFGDYGVYSLIERAKSPVSESGSSWQRASD
jgi:hypothetical protein